MISTGQMAGRWKNSKANTKGIAEFALEEVDSELLISINGAEEGFLPNNIGPIVSTPHSANESSDDCIAFQADTTIDGVNYFFAGNINKGLVIIATYIKSSEISSNFFVREFFYKQK